MTHSTHPFEYLEILEQCAIRYSSEIPEAKAQAAFWDGVGFKMSNHLFTVGIGEISEVLPVPQITPLPGVKHWAKGIANVHGRLIPIIDLREFLGLSGSAKSSSNRIIVIDQKELSVGLVVDEVQGRLHLLSSTYQETTPANLPECILPYTGGSYQHTAVHTVFDTRQLITSDPFLAAASD